MDGRQGPEAGSGVASAPASGEDATIADLLRSLAAIRPCADSAGLIDQLRELEDLQSAAAGLQARIAVAFDAVQRRPQAAAGLPRSELGKGEAEINTWLRRLYTAPSSGDLVGMDSRARLFPAGCAGVRAGPRPPAVGTAGKCGIGPSRSNGPAPPGKCLPDYPLA
jgi:hypothetical protein